MRSNVLTRLDGIDVIAWRAEQTKTGDRAAAGVARAGADRPALPGRRAAPLHRLRDVVPRGDDRPGARRCRRSSSCSGPSGTPTCSSSSRTRARRRSRSRPRGRGAGPRWLVTGKAGRADRRALRRGRRLHAGDRGELVPHGELHVRGRGDRRAARQGRVVAAGRGRGGADGAAARRSASRSGSSSPAPAGDWPTAQEAVLKLREGAWVAAEAHTRSSCSTATSLRSTSRCAPSCSRARASRSGGRSAAAGGAARARLRRRPRADAASRRRHRPVPAADGRARRAPRPRAGPDPPPRPALGRRRAGGETPPNAEPGSAASASPRAVAVTPSADLCQARRRREAPATSLLAVAAAGGGLEPVRRTVARQRSAA